MALHHVAVATRDLAATHAFYTDAMGFELVKVVAGDSPGGGWARHAFYDTGRGELIAFWDIHDDAEVPDDFEPSISGGLGLPAWTNHLAFDAPSLADLDACRRRWLDAGYDVAEVDHGWCTSIYAMDPNGIMVEWCTTTQSFTETDRADAHRLLQATAPELEPMPPLKVHRAARAEAPA